MNWEIRLLFWHTFAPKGRSRGGGSVQTALLLKNGESFYFKMISSQSNLDLSAKVGEVHSVGWIGGQKILFELYALVQYSYYINLYKCLLSTINILYI